MMGHASAPPRSGPRRIAAGRGVRLAALLATATLCGCSLLVPRLETPHLSVVGIDVVEASAMEQRFNVRMRVQNPNGRALPIRGLSYTMRLAGEDFGRGLMGKSFTVPPLGEAEFDMTVTTNLAMSLLRILPKLQHGQDALDYELKGKVSTDLGLLKTIPFTERGTLSMH